MRKDIKALLSTAREEEQHREEWRLRLALLKENATYRGFWDECGDKARQAHKHIQDFYARRDCTEGMDEETANAFFSECKEALEVSSIFNGILREQFGIDIGGYLPCFRWDEWLDCLNPYKLNDNAIVRFYYPLPAISQVVRLQEGQPDEHRYSTIFPSKERGNELLPSERLLRVDLSRKRSELVREFALFLDLVEAHRAGDDVPEEWKLNYATWEPDNSRFRSEAWQALAVWRLRRQRTAYRDITRIVEIGLSAAKMAFRRAYELIESRPYAPEAFRRENLPVNISELPRTCADCPIRNTCEELCPDMLRYVEQDQSSQRELTVDSIDPYDIEAEDIENIMLSMIDENE